MHKEVNTLANVLSESPYVQVFNDDRTDRPYFKREHLVLLEVEMIFGASHVAFTAEQKKWNGKNAGFTLLKNKKKFWYTGRDMGEAVLSKQIFVNDKTFKGSAYILDSHPDPVLRLSPFDAPNRTLIG